MDVSHILAPLNDAQRQAVTAPPLPTLVLAGAGSGKTRVLTHRVEWLVQVEGVSPHGILAVTFTNKAAAEMRHRIETQLGLPSAPLWIGTFHGISHRLLRLHWREAGLPQGFQILDSEDQQRLVKKIIRGLNLDDTRWVPREVAWFINKQKDEGLRPKHLKDDGDPTRRQMIKLYEAYEEACRRNGVVDFAELLLRSCEILRESPGLAEHYRARFRHVLVDEFQDTNTVQYEWMKVLDGLHGHPVRGRRRRPVDLSLAWRAGREPAAIPQGLSRRAAVPARAELSLDRQHPRRGQRDHREQQRPHRQEAVDQRRRGHAHPAVPRLQRARRSRVRRQQDPGVGSRAAATDATTAILYRSNAQSRVFEEYLLAARIPYRVYGGLRFFERQEIKDALAYLQADLQPRRRRLVRARREPADPRHRRPIDRGAARACTRAHGLDVASGKRVRRRPRRQGHRLPAGIPDADREARRRDAWARRYTNRSIT